MRGFQKFEPAEFHERNVAPRQLDFERGAVMGCTKQHGLRFEANARLTVGKDCFDDVARLGGVIRHIYERRPIRRGAVRPEVFGEALGGKIDDGIGGGQDRLRRAVVSFQRDQFSLRA